MKNYHFEFKDEKRQLACTEYIYEIGSFHYNWHKDIEILLVLKGEVEVCAGNELYLLNENDAILINSNEGHATFPRMPGSIAFLFRINPDFMESFIPDYKYLRFQYISLSEQPVRYETMMLRKYMADMMLARTDQITDELLFESALYGIINLITKSFSYREDKNVLGLDNNEDIIKKIIQYIEGHFTEKITLESVAEEFNYNSSYFSLFFRNSVGINFYEYLTRRRLREAIREIDRTDKKILDIADSTGFPNLKAFNTKFKALFGRTPTEYRKSLESVNVRDSLNYVKAYVSADNKYYKNMLMSFSKPGSGFDFSNVNASAVPNIAETERLAKELRAIADKLENIDR